MRKLIGVFILCEMMVGFSAAQSRSPKNVDLIEDKELPKISVGELKWEKAIAAPRFSSSELENPGLVNPDIFRRLPDPIPPGGLKIYYEYRASFKNDGRKKIVGVSWEYIFHNLDSNAELDRHKFFSFQTIGKGKSAFAKGTAYAPPSKVVTYKSLEKDKRSPYNERVEVRCVLYSDNTFWKRGKVAAEECKMLNFHRRRYRQRRRLFD